MSPTPIVAPLIATDKTEIIEVAKQIGTFEVSLLPYGSRCFVFWLFFSFDQ